ncbi:SymE family type I addiction module toxin [Flavobacterium sp. FlaQc-48]|uniref:SymE family type I addiction module toxin n=1 Tax=Flavobacterium sp. FlaQc-48 TaxID=3374181 RepID=UPI003756CAC0
MKNLRKLKIHTKYKPGIRTYTTIPVVKLEGKWLNKLGFNEGQMVNIEQKNKKLIITIDKQQE